MFLFSFQESDHLILHLKDAFYPKVYSAFKNRAGQEKSWGPVSCSTGSQKHFRSQVCHVQVFRELKKTIKTADSSGCSLGFFNTCFLSLLILWKVSQLWRSSSIVPVPKIGVPSAPRGYRPVALTSHRPAEVPRGLRCHRLRLQWRWVIALEPCVGVCLEGGFPRNARRL